MELLEATLRNNHSCLSLSDFLRRAGLVLGLVVLLLLIWEASEFILLTFAGILLAVFLYNLATWVENHLPLRYGLSLAIVGLVLIGLLCLMGFLFANVVAEQVSGLSEQLPQAIQKARQSLQKHEWLRLMIPVPPAPKTTNSASLKATPSDSVARSGPNRSLNTPTDTPREEHSNSSVPNLPLGVTLLSRVTKLFSGTVEAIAGILMILFTGIFVAVDPQLYRAGLMHLVPLQRRDDASDILFKLGRTLRLWLFGQLMSMISVGLLVGLGLLILRMPLALGLALVTGLLEFIPTVGPILSAVPALLIALGAGGMKPLYVLLLYLIIHQIEGNIIIPLIQRQTVRLPPVITIIAIVVFGNFFGFLGLLLATPMAASLLVLVREIYVKRILGDPLKLES